MTGYRLYSTESMKNSSMQNIPNIFRHDIWLKNMMDINIDIHPVYV